MSSITPIRPPRPKWTDTAVRLSVLDAFLPRLEAWCIGHGIGADEDDDPGQFSRDLRALLALALTECSDAYRAARYLDEFADLPADVDLVLLMGAAFEEMKRAAPGFVSDWTMRHRIRFGPAREHVIRFRVGNVSLTGTVVDIVQREGKALVAVRRGETTDHIWAFAEDVIEDHGPSRPAKKSGRSKP